MDQADKLFIARVKPWDYFFITSNRNEIVAWWNSNEDSFGDRQVKKIRWSQLANAKGFEMNKIEEALYAEDVQKGWTPKVITGGKGPPDLPGDPNDPDWLTPLKDGTVFLVEHKKSTDVFALQVQVISHALRCVLVSMAGHQKPEWTIPLRFCRDFRFIETIMTAEEFEIELKAREQIEASNILGMKED